MSNNYQLVSANITIIIVAEATCAYGAAAAALGWPSSSRRKK